MFPTFSIAVLDHGLENLILHLSTFDLDSELAKDILLQM